MAIKFYRAGEIRPKTNLSYIVYGKAGAGKTSLMQTCRRPVLIDFDDGADRGHFGGDHFTLDRWEDAESPEFEKLLTYGDTIVIDTIAKLGSGIVQAIIRSDENRTSRSGNSLLGTKTGGLTQQGYGVLLSRFRVWMAWVKEKGKDVAVSAHERTVVVKQGREREYEYAEFRMIGGYRQEIAEDVDMIARMSAADNGRRELSFDGNTFQVAKNPLGWKEPRVLPAVESPAYRTFMGDLVAEVKDGINSRAANIRAGYASGLAEFREEVEAADSASRLNELANRLKLDYSLPQSALMDRVESVAARAKDLGLVRKQGAYVVEGEESAIGDDADAPAVANEEQPNEPAAEEKEWGLLE